MTGFEDKKS